MSAKVNQSEILQAIADETAHEFALVDWSNDILNMSEPPAVLAGPELISTRSVTSGGARAVGDPHVANIMGDRFDIMRVGTYTLLQIPRHVENVRSMLTVIGRVDRGHRKTMCGNMWIRNLQLYGSLVGMDFGFHVPNGTRPDRTFVMRVGNLTTNSPSNFANSALGATVTSSPGPAFYGDRKIVPKYGGAKVIANIIIPAGEVVLTLDLIRFPEAADDHIDLNVKNIQKIVGMAPNKRIGKNMIGGILGVDDHRSALNSECTKKFLISKVGDDAMRGDDQYVPRHSFIEATM